MVRSIPYKVKEEREVCVACIKETSAVRSSKSTSRHVNDWSFRLLEQASKRGPTNPVVIILDERSKANAIERCDLKKYANLWMMTASS